MLFTMYKFLLEVQYLQQFSEVGSVFTSISQTKIWDREVISSKITWSVVKVTLHNWLASQFMGLITTLLSSDKNNVRNQRIW